MSWKNVTADYLIKVCASNKEDYKYSAYIHPDYSVVYNWMQQYYSDYDQYPEPDFLSEKFSLESDILESRLKMSEVQDRLVNGFKQYQIDKAVLDLQDCNTSTEPDIKKAVSTVANLVDKLTLDSGSSLSTREYLKTIVSQAKSVRDGKVIKYGFPNLDKHTGGIKPAQYVLVMGKTHSGKSVLTRKMAINMMKEGHRVLYITLENSAEESQLSCLSLLFGVSPDKLFESPQVPLDVKRAAKKNHHLLTQGDGEIIFKSDFEANTVAELSHVVRDIEPDIIILDQMSHFLPRGMGKTSTTELYFEQSSQLQKFMRKTGIPMIILAQAKRDATGVSEDVGWAYKLSQDARVVLFIKDKEPNPYGEGDIRKIKLVKCDHKDSGMDLEQLWDRNKGLIQELDNSIEVDNSRIGDAHVVEFDDEE